MPLLWIVNATKHYDHLWDRAGRGEIGFGARADAATGVYTAHVSSGASGIALVEIYEVL